MSIKFFSIIMIALAVGYIWITARCKKASNQSEYFLAGRGLGTVLLALSILATQIGGGMILGSAEIGSQNGWGALLWPLGNALGLITVGLGLGKRLRRMEVTTLAELYTSVYRFGMLRRFASILSIVSLFLILTAQLIASRQFLEVIGITSPIPFLAIWALVVVYTVVGGLRAVVLTDALQAAFIGVILIAAFFVAPKVPSSIPAAPSEWQFSSIFLMPFLFMVIGQDMGQRCFAGKNGRVVSRAFLLAGLGSFLIGAIPVAFGVRAKGQGLQGAQILLGASSSPVMQALLGAAVVVALVSTVDSLICAISSNLSNDFGRFKLRTAQLITLFVGLGAMGATFFFQQIAAVLIFSYELSVSCLAVSMIAALFVKRGNPRAALFSIVGGAIGFLFLPSPLYALLLSSASYGAGLLFRQKSVIPEEVG